MEISITLTQDQSERLARLKDAPARLLPPLARAWAAGAQEILGRAVKGRFTGQGPYPVAQNRLGVVTNRLRKSLRATGAQLDVASGTISAALGSNVSYFAPHEFGFKGRVQVRGHTRKAVADAKRTSRGKLTKKAINDLKVSKLVRGRANYSYVKPHARQVHIPARRPLGTEIAAPATRASLWKLITAVVNRILK